MAKKISFPLEEKDNRISPEELVKKLQNPKMRNVTINKDVPLNSETDIYFEILLPFQNKSVQISIVHDPKRTPGGYNSGKDVIFSWELENYNPEKVLSIFESTDFKNLSSKIVSEENHFFYLEMDKLAQMLSCKASKYYTEADQERHTEKFFKYSEEK